MEQPIFWSDQIAFGVTKKFEEREKHTCAAGVSPSGIVHGGHLREVLTVDFVVKSLKKRGEDVRFIYSWDDYDRFRKVPKNVPEEFEKYIGLPLTKVPDPWECHDSYAEHFEKKFEESVEDMHLDIEFISQTEMFERSEYAELIKKALNEKDKIIKILNKYRKEPLDEKWLPLRVYCRECGKDFTEILDYDGDYEVRYRCKMCDIEEKTNFKEKDSVKPPWRVDWPMRWFYENVSFEPAGKEHSVEGGSRTTGQEIIREVYGEEPPVYQMYDFVTTASGQKISSSSAENIFTVDDLKEIYSPEMIRFLFTETKPNKEFVIPFDENTVQRYSKFDRVEEIYFNPEKEENEKKRKHLKRVYELAVVDIPEEQPVRPPFDHLAFLTQTRPREEWGKSCIESLRKTGHIEKELSEKQKELVIERMEKAFKWARKHAPERYVYEINEEIEEELKEKLSQKEKEAMLKIAEVLRKKDFKDSSELDNALFGIKDESGLSTKDFFRAAYICLLNRERGPRLSNFILGVGEKRIASVLESLK